jgi:hypothetical protein
MPNPKPDRRADRLITAAAIAVALLIVAATVAGPILAVVRP